MQTIFLNHQKHFDTYQGVFWKEETKGYLNMNKKKVLQLLSMCEWACKLPNNSLFL